MRVSTNQRLEKLKEGWAKVAAASPKKERKRAYDSMGPRHASDMAGFLLNGLERALDAIARGDEKTTHDAFAKMRNVLNDFMIGKK